MKLSLYIVIIILLIFCILFLFKNVKENYDKVEKGGPWGNIGTGKPWYDYPYILNNIEY